MESSVDAEGVGEPPAPADFAIKLLHLSEFSVELGTALLGSSVDGMLVWHGMVCLISVSLVYRVQLWFL